MPLVHPIAEVERLSAASTTPLARVLTEIAQAIVHRDDRAQTAARARLADLLRQTLRYAIVLGRRRVLLEADASVLKATRIERRVQLRENSSAVIYVEFATARTPLMPRIAFDEAIADLLARDDRLAFGYEAVQRLYADEHAFALAQSIDLHVTERVHMALGKMLRTGTTLENAQDVIQELGRWTRGYAETVYRTNVATAYSAGRFIQAADPDVEVVFKAFEFVTAGDVDVRHNHAAGHGAVAGTRDPMWDRLAPPLGYNCRCQLELVDRFELEERGLIRQGHVERWLPPSAGNWYPDPGFGGGRPDRRLAGLAA